jgi:protein deglycase
MASPIITVLAEGFEETEAVTPIDLLRRAGIEVLVLGLNTGTVHGSHNIPIVTDGLLNEFHGTPGGIMLPGGPGYKNLLNSTTVLSIVRTIFGKGLLCAAICAAPSVFGKAGILKGRRATCFPGVEPELTGATFIGEPVVIDGTVITSRGAGTAVPFALAIIEYLKGADAANGVASTIVYR